MNILITNDDGPEAAGLGALRDAVKRAWKEARVILITPRPHSSGLSMSVNPKIKPSEFSLDHMERVDKDHYVIDGTPTDAVDLAVLRSDLFLPRGPNWTYVLSGVNAGDNVGVDILRSGTCGAAITASLTYGLASIAFSQMLKTEPSKDTPRAEFKTADAVLGTLLQGALPNPGEAWNINFPASAPTGYVDVPIAHYSRWRPPPSNLVPRARGEKSDLTELMAGYVTKSTLDLRLSRPLRY